MLAKRVIPCLDVDGGRVVKGVNFKDLKDMGDPVELGKQYSNEGADELVFLDITATTGKRKILVDLVKRVASEIYIPFTVGGGIETVEEMRLLLRAGADKIAINSAAIMNPRLIIDGATQFGCQCIVLAIDVKKVDVAWEVYREGGKIPTGLNILTWAQKAVSLGAGEILLTSIDRDGKKSGYDTELLRTVSEGVSVPVIASGGAGRLSDFKKAFKLGKADAVLAASLFHTGEISIQAAKQYLNKNKIQVRL